MFAPSNCSRSASRFPPTWRLPLDSSTAWCRRTNSLAQRLAKQPLGSLLATKRLMRNAETLTTQMEAEGEYFESRLKSAEAREAFRAFAERRPPDFAKVT